MLRPYFKFHRNLLPQLCLCAWESLREFFAALLSKNALPGAILTINTACEFLGWQSHVHRIVLCGGFLQDGEFESVPTIDACTMRRIFEAKVFSMLLKRELIIHDLANKILSLKYSGFDAWIRPAIRDMKEIVEIGLYTVRTPAAVGRLVLGNESYVKYAAKGT